MILVPNILYRMRYNVNFQAEYRWFDFRVVDLLDKLNNLACPIISSQPKGLKCKQPRPKFELGLPKFISGVRIDLYII